MKALVLLEMVETAGLAGNGSEMQELVTDLGGWDVVLNAWHATGGRAGAFANVWEMVVHLTNNQAEFAERMQISPQTVAGYVETLQAMVVTKRAGEAEAALRDLCSALAAGYEDLAVTISAQSTHEAPDIDADDAKALGAWWRERFDKFSHGVLSYA